MEQTPFRIALLAAAFIGVLTLSTFALQGADQIYKGDPQSFRLVAEDPFGDGHLILEDADVHDQGVAYRYGRILVPLVGWVMAGAQADLVVWTLPLVGILGFAVSAFLAARLCRMAGKPADRGFLVVAVPTMITSTVLVYSEPVAIALLLGVYVSYLEDRRRLAVGLALFLPLAREAYLVGLLPLAFAELRRLSLRHTATVGAVVVTPYLAWLVWVRGRVGDWTFTDPSTSRTDAVGLPGVSLVEAIGDADGEPAVIVGALLVACLGLAGFVVAVVLLRRMKRDRLLLWALLGFAVLGLMVGPQGYRFSGDGLRVLLPGHLLLALIAARNLGNKEGDAVENVPAGTFSAPVGVTPDQ
ncbi:MAG: hypothetical protein RIB98_10800 [Acidimicrobiales bacterium]